MVSDLSSGAALKENMHYVTVKKLSHVDGEFVVFLKLHVDVL